MQHVAKGRMTTARDLVRDAVALLETAPPSSDLPIRRASALRLLAHVDDEQLEHQAVAYGRALELWEALVCEVPDSRHRRSGLAGCLKGIPQRSSTRNWATPLGSPMSCGRMACSANLLTA
jgi:hypothetical protein